jgi:hypothetical protein
MCVSRSTFHYSNNRLKIQIVGKRDLIFLVLYVFKCNKKEKEKRFHFSDRV